MVGYYDYVLALIPAMLLGVSGALRLGGHTQTSALIVGGLLAIGITVHALFIRSPVHGTNAAVFQERSDV